MEQAVDPAHGDADPVGAVVELGERFGIQMPATKAVYACAAMLNDRDTYIFGSRTAPFSARSHETLRYHRMV